MRQHFLHSAPRRPVHRLSGRCRTRVQTPEVNSVKDTVSEKYILKIAPQNPKYKRILCIDGGGLRGLVPAQVLKYLETGIVKYAVEKGLSPEGVPQTDLAVDLADYFDVIAGTSVGSLVALYLASKGVASKALLKGIGRPDLRPGSAEAMAEIIAAKGKVIFPKSRVPDWPKIRGLSPRDLALLFGPKYSSEGLKGVLKEAFGDLTLKDAFTKVVVPSFDLETKRAFTFLGGDNFSGYAAVNNHATNVGDVRKLVVNPDLTYTPDIDFIWDTDYHMREVGLASTSAPTYFNPAKISSVQLTNSGTFIDGGVVANNPTIQAIVASILKEPLGVNYKPIESTAVFSIGTCSTLPDTSNLIDAGALGWLKSGALINILMNGSSEYLQAVVDALYYGFKKRPLPQYLRINKTVETGSPDAEEFDELDNTDDIPGLYKAGDELGELYSTNVIPSFVEEFLLAEK